MPALMALLRWERGVGVGSGSVAGVAVGVIVADVVAADVAADFDDVLMNVLEGAEDEVLEDCRIEVSVRMTCLDQNERNLNAQERRQCW
jgi:hypothetical protein